MGEMGTEPRLYPQNDRDRAYVAPLPESPRRRLGELPWYSIFRVKTSDLVILGTLLMSLTVAYYKVQSHEVEIANIKAAMQTKESATGDSKLIIQRLDDMKERFDSKFDDVNRRLDRIEVQKSGRR